jgi:Ca-activated chloride channel family protein
MTFQTPALLWLIVALVPVALLWRKLHTKRRARLENFADKSTWHVLNPAVSVNARRWKSIIFFAAVAFAIIAAARPQWGTREREVRQRGIDILVAIDVSQSMLAEDIRPNRLAQAKEKFDQLLGAFPGQRIGVLPFAGEAFLQAPLTTDYGIARRVLQNVGPDSVGTPGTDIASAVSAARTAFRESAIGTPVLIMITDGENHEEGWREEVAAAAEEGVRIYSLGIGSPEGTVIRTAGGPLRDREGNTVVSKLDTQTLKEMAEMTNGAAWMAPPGQEIDVRPIIAQLERLEKADFSEEGRKRVIREERYQIPLALALALFFAEGLIGERRRRPAPVRRRTQTA